jgi:hypothetical protein
MAMAVQMDERTVRHERSFKQASAGTCLQDKRSAALGQARKPGGFTVPSKEQEQTERTEGGASGAQHQMSPRRLRNTLPAKLTQSLAGKVCA